MISSYIFTSTVFCFFSSRSGLPEYLIQELCKRRESGKPNMWTKQRHHFQMNKNLPQKRNVSDFSESGIQL